MGKTNELKTHLDEAFKLISSLSVSGDAVDVVAAARNQLRAAYALIQKQEKEEPLDD